MIMSAQQAQFRLNWWSIDRFHVILVRFISYWSGLELFDSQQWYWKSSWHKVSEMGQAGPG